MGDLDAFPFGRKPHRVFTDDVAGADGGGEITIVDFPPDRDQLAAGGLEFSLGFGQQFLWRWLRWLQ